MAHSRVGVYDGKIAGLYDLEETLGSGHFAVVKLARHVFTGEKVAVKVIDKTKLDEVSRAHLFQEVRCMKLVQHPNVVRLYEVIDTQTKLYLILELGDGGDLYDYIMKHESGLSEQLAKEYFRQIVKAIKYCHQLHVVHRDLKPENVVFFEKLGVVKLTDFGFSNKFCPGQKLETSCGSLAYSAPEILLGDSYDAPAVDIWSLGVILYMLVCGQPPFQEANDSETLTMIMDCKYTMPAHVSIGCKRLISTMLVREPENRATLQQIAQDEWLNDGGIDQAPEYLPLVSREQVSEDDHSLIIQKIVNGNIATKDEILEALDRNEYNHITATYFLLAERKLRAHRQEQAQRRKPELNLPVVAGAGRLSPRARVQNLKRDLQSSVEDSDDQQHLLAPSLLNVPRTPGADGIQTGRARKCSIVQEEDDEDECSGREESSPLNRRGSRSEGRINIAVQDRIAEADRIKKENATNHMMIKNVDGISGVKVLTGENCDPKMRLGMSGLGRLNNVLFRKHDIPTIGNVVLCGSTPKEHRSNSIDNHHVNIMANRTEDEETTTKFLTDSSTITIPLQLAKGEAEEDSCYPPKYKTMPSPTKSSNAVLNEIFEEGTDIGSSDSATTTPRPMNRHNQFTNSRTQSQQGPAQRRAKFHKTRTASCSSSDASDDDSENRKKRAHKIVDSTGKPFHQRRDSHDDSSDSQDPGNAVGGATGGNGTAFCPQISAAQNSSNRNGQKSHTTTTNTNGQSKGQQVGFRRHRAGRRKAGETRLRESQSLNRITEVQESDIGLISNQMANGVVSNPTAEDQNNVPPSPEPHRNTETSSSHVENSQTVPPKPKGFSARLLQGFKKSSSENKDKSHSNSSDPGDASGSKDVDIMLGVDLTKAIKNSESKGTTATKKLKMLGKYFQVHKKICNIPIPKFFDRGRLYKAQSCGSIVRDKINPNPSGMAVLRDLRDGNNNSSTNGNSISNDNNKKSANQKLLKANLGTSSAGQRLMGSEGDINQNLHLNGGDTPNGIPFDSNNNSSSNKSNRTNSLVPPEEGDYHFLGIVSNKSGEHQKLILATTTTKTASTPLMINKIMINGTGAVHGDSPPTETGSEDKSAFLVGNDSHHLIQNPLNRHSLLGDSSLCSSKC